MTIRHIRIFIAVYRAMNMTRAAEELHMAQPAVTRAIQEMEHYYGVRLFERLGRHLAATECAKELYGYAVHIDDTFAVMERRLGRGGRAARGRDNRDRQLRTAAHRPPVSGGETRR